MTSPKVIQGFILFVLITINHAHANDLYGKDFTENIVKLTHMRSKLKFRDKKTSIKIFKDIVTKESETMFLKPKFKEVIVKKFRLPISKKDVEDLFGLDYLYYEGDDILHTGYLEILAIRDINSTMLDVIYYKDDMLYLDTGRYLAKLDSIGEVECYIDQYGKEHTIGMFTEKVFVEAYFLRHPKSLPYVFNILTESLTSKDE